MSTRNALGNRKKNHMVKAEGSWELLPSLRDSCTAWEVGFGRDSYQVAQRGAI